MKTTTLTLSALAVLVGLAACNKENFNSSSYSPIEGNTVKVTLSANQDSNITRAAIGETTDGKTAVLWSENDSLSVFDGANKNIKFSIKDGVGTTSGTFEGEVSETSDSYVALYPYQSAASINKDRNTISGVTLKSIQTATAGSFDPEAALMTAVETTEGTLSFKNVVGYVKVTPTFDCTKISLISNNSSDALAGTVSVNIASDGTPTVSGASDASNSVSIEGNIAANSTYYIAVLPCTLSSGFKLVLTDSDDNTISKTSTNTLTIKRNTITDLGNISNTDGGDTTPYVTFSAESAQTFKMTRSWNTVANTFEYSVGDGEWENITFSTEVPFGDDKGDLRLRGKNDIGTAASTSNYIEISFNNDAKVTCSGDIRTLVNWENYSTVSTANARFVYLFYGCNVLISAPELPATTLATYCYYGMFFGCTSLETAPELPAETLADACYYYMFRNCKSLTTAPELPAKTLASNCYYNMFCYCTSLTAAPALPATTLATYCYTNMFSNCTSLTSAPKLPAETLASGCYYSMFSYCKLLATAPELPAKTLASNCYTSMFSNCTSLTAAPELPAETLVSSCYSSMFYYCTSLTTVPGLPAETLASNCYQSMFDNCTSLQGAIELPAKTLADYCYAGMFSSCTSLTSIILRATSVGNNSLQRWLDYAYASDGKTRTLYTDLSLEQDGWTVKGLSSL